MQFLKNRIPPPLVLVAFCIPVYFSDRIFSLTPFGRVPLVVFAIVALVCGIAISGKAVQGFKAKQTTLNPMKPEEAAALVTTGIYTKTRNPMYLGLLLILLAVIAFNGNLFALVVVPFFVLYMNVFQIIPEERALRARFGDEFSRYTASVRRWI